ncbi:hypothetical protein [Actinokineospora sp. HUAS TT18]|uniref:hypothetical protein n=1 Tax=Actinokineospora sp. HUAS TT18 TaxID=3447451 RepID=UPI003F526BD9
MYRIMAGLVGLTAVTALGLGMAGHSVTGVASPVGDTDLRAAVLSVCPYSGTSLRQGTMVRDIQGGYSLAAPTADGRLLFCTNNFNGDSSHSMEPQPVKLNDAKIGGTYGHGLSWSVHNPIGFTAVGHTAADVTRVEILVPDGTVVSAVAQDGAFAFTVRGFDVDSLLTMQGRAFNAAGDLIYEGLLNHLPPN